MLGFVFRAAMRGPIQLEVVMFNTVSSSLFSSYVVAVDRSLHGRVVLYLNQSKTISR